MSTKLLLALVVACWVLAASVSRGQEVVLPPPRPVPALPAPAEPCPPPPPQEHTVSTLNAHLVEEQTLQFVPRPTLQEVLARVPTADVDIEYKEETRSCTVMVLKPRWEERVVTAMTPVPEVTTDPCTGCAHIDYKQVPVTKTVQVQVFDQVPETREYVVKVPVVRPVEKQALFRRFTLVTTPQPEIEKTFKLIAVPNELKIPAPSCALPSLDQGAAQPAAPPPAGPRERPTPEPPPAPRDLGKLPLPEDR
jgi:hypothetical protein